MKITYKLIAQYLFLCLITTLTKSQQYYSYTESTLETQDTPPLVADIKTYNDGTILVHVIRNDSTQSNSAPNRVGFGLENFDPKTSGRVRVGQNPTRSEH